jgi:hypothetical protein
MSQPEESRPLPWLPLLLTAGVLGVATELRRERLALAALATLVLVPTAWRLVTKQWKRGDVLRGLGMGFAACHLPLLLGALATLARPECRVRLCLDALVSTGPYVPWAGLLGTLLYWAWAAPVPESRDPEPPAPE